MRRLLFMTLMLSVVSVCKIDTWASEDANNNLDTADLVSSENEQNEQDVKKKSPDSKNELLNRSGFYSTFGLRLNNHKLSGVLSIPSFSERQQSKTETDKNNLGVDLSLGYDRKIGFLTLGGGTSVGLNTGSNIEYSEKFKVADVNLKNEYSLFVKAGINLGDKFTLYGKTGGNFLKFDYSLKTKDSSPKKHDHLLFPFYAIGIDFFINDSFSINTECLLGSSKDQDALNVSDSKNKLQNSSSRVWQIKLGASYRF